jgi:hypothetical protein
LTKFFSLSTNNKWGQNSKFAPITFLILIYGSEDKQIQILSVVLNAKLFVEQQAVNLHFNFALFTIIQIKMQIG